MLKVAIVFDDVVGVDALGKDCLRALQQMASERRLASVEHILPSKLTAFFKGEFDLFLFVDDGLDYPIPKHCQPSAWWASDTQLSIERCLSKARQAVWTFAAQGNGIDQLKMAGIEDAVWLPLVCDPNQHGLGQENFVQRTYRDRMEQVLETVQSHLSPSRLGKTVLTQSSCSKASAYFSHERQDVLELVPLKAQRVLDIGCGVGKLGKAIKSRQSAHVTGVERDPLAAGEATKVLDDVHQTDIERADFAFTKGIFDCVICADVLEHLRFPERLLQKIYDWLAPGGVLVTSLPNVQNLAVVQSLLAGNWTYESSGLLDEDHVRFFTRREIEKMLSRTGFDFQEMRMIPGPGAEEWVKRGRPAQVTLGDIQVDLPSLDQASEFMAYQYLTRSKRLGKQAYGLTSIIVVTHNQCDYTSTCLDSLRLRTDEPYELIVVDNGSTDGSLSFLQSAGVDQLILNETNRGFPAAVNQGISVARGEQILLLNNDTIVTTGWLRRMLDVFAFDSGIGLIGPVSNRVSGEQQIKVNYRQLADLDGFAWDWGKRHGHELVATNRLVGFCLLIRRNVIESIGQFDEQFGIGNFEDDDFCRRAIQAGFRAVIARGAFVHHFGSATFRQSGIDFDALLQQNKKIFLQKWSGDETAANFENLHSAEPSEDLTHSEPGNVRLSVCMIVRDNEETIGPCLKSIRPWVDEIVVVDTGSTDRTPEICEALGARVYHRSWQDSFSAARNLSLELARGEWIFWMDSDDTIPSECGEKLRELAYGSHGDETLGYVMQVHCPGKDDRDITAVDHVKLIRNRPELRFEFRIHEQILPAIRRAGGDVKWSDIYVVHSGADRTDEGRLRKLHRDLRLLELDLSEKPDHPFVLFNLGMTYNDAGQHDRAIQFLRRCITVSVPAESHLRKAFALLVASQIKQGQHEAARKDCNDGLRMFPDDQELIFRKAMLDHQEGKLEASAVGYQCLLSTNVGRYFSSMDVGITGYKARHNLAIVLEEMKLFEEAITQWTLLLAERPGYFPALSALNRLENGSSITHVA